MSDALWISCYKFTGQVNINKKRVIILAPPCWKRFMGQGVENLIGWLRARFGETQVLPLREETCPTTKK